MKKLIEKIKRTAIAQWFLKFFRKYQVYVKSDAFVFEYSNETDSVQNAILFGFNGFAPKDNFGNDKLGIKCLNEGVKYYQSLHQSAHKPFKIAKLRIQSKDMKWYYDKSITYHGIDANGVQTTAPTVIVNHVDVYQQQEDIVDINRFNYFPIDATKHFSFVVKENSKLVLSVFPIYAKYVNYWQYRKAQKQEAREQLKKATIIYANMNFKEWIKAWFKGLFRK